MHDFPTRFDLPADIHYVIRCDCGRGLVTDDRIDCRPPRAGADWNKRGVTCVKITHAQSATVEYHTWFDLIRRCTDEVAPQWKNYGGRGIRVAKRWLTGASRKSGFECFRVDMGARPGPKHSIDRIDVNGHYEPANCRWALPVVQGGNRRNCVMVELRGEKVCLAEAARQIGVTRGRLGYYLKKAEGDFAKAYCMIKKAAQKSAC